MRAISAMYFWRTVDVRRANDKFAIWMATEFSTTFIIRKHSDLADAFAAIKNYLQISNECLEEISGLTKGAADKLLGPSRTKKIGPTSFDLLLGALGIELVVRPDPTAKVASRYEKRNTLQVRQSQRVSQAMLDRCRPIILAELAWQMGAGYKGEAHSPFLQLATRAQRRIIGLQGT